MKDTIEQRLERVKRNCHDAKDKKLWNLVKWYKEEFYLLEEKRKEMNERESNLGKVWRENVKGI